MPHRPSARLLLTVIAATALSMSYVLPARACPFCKADKPTLAQQCETADVVALAEVLPAEHITAVKACIVRIHSSLKGREHLGDGPITVSVQPAPPAGSLVLLLGTTDGDVEPGDHTWQLLEVDEAVIGYIAGSPAPRTAAAERLPYFARFLEHPHALVAEDAYLEFAHAPYDVVAAAAHSLPMDAIRGWIVDPAVPVDRKGFYGLALGLSTDPQQRAANVQLLHQLAAQTAVDYRTGYDGILGGYLVAAGEPALEWIEQQILADPQSAEGDVRHALNALRFYHESCREIAPEQLCLAVRHLLARPEFAATAIVDLARWQDWTARERIVGLYDLESTSHRGSIRRAIVGYLLVCPDHQAAVDLDRFRMRDPELVTQAERQPFLPGRRD